jgi:hypothetical protein
MKTYFGHPLSLFSSTQKNCSLSFTARFPQKLLIASFSVPCTFPQAFEGHLRVICFPCVRKDGVRWNSFADMLDEGEAAKDT